MRNPTEVLGICLMVLCAIPATGYQWPLDPVSQPHGITGTLAEFRGPERGHYFHRGVDMHAAAGSPVRSVEAGTITVINDQQVWVDDKRYLHINWHGLGLHRGDQVTRGQVIGRIAPGRQGMAPHLHFGDYDGETPENPLGPGHLDGAPGCDTESPEVIDMWFQQDNTARCLPDTCTPEGSHFTVVRGRIDIVSRAQDAMPSPGSARVGLYRMWYRIRDRYLPTIHKGREKFSKKS